MTRGAVVVAVALAGLVGLAGCGGRGDGSDPRIELPGTPSATSGPASPDERASMLDFAEDALRVALHRSPTAEDYDADVVDATRLMTAGYAARFRSLALASRNDVVGNALTVDSDVLGAGVVSATPVRGRVLLFADQRSSQRAQKPATSRQAVVMTVQRDGSGWLVSDLQTSRTRGAPEPDRGRRAALTAATRVARLLVNIDYRTVDRSLAAITALGTGEFREEYQDDSGEVARKLVDNESVMTGLVLAAGAVEADDDEATVLVATNGQVSNTSTDGLLVARSFRMQVHLTRTDGRWLTDTLDFV